MVKLDDAAAAPRLELTVNEQFAALWDKVKRAVFWCPAWCCKLRRVEYWLLFNKLCGQACGPLAYTAIHRIIDGRRRCNSASCPDGQMVRLCRGRWFLVLGFGILQRHYSD